MTITPWGDAEGLRERKLSPGPGMDQKAVLANQRERLFAATVAVVAEKGYEATRVEDILLLAGVSRNAFYRQFSSKLDCFLATLREIERGSKLVTELPEHTPGNWEDRLRALLDALGAVIVAQPAMARVGWIEVYAAGPEAIESIERIDEAVEEVVVANLKASPARADMPREVVRAIVGGVRKIGHSRIRDDRIDELPELMPQLLDWMCGYHTPPERLRRPRRIPPELVVERRPPRDPRERILAAVTEIVAEKGYPNMAITEIAARANVSLTTFYQHFDGKQTAFQESFLDGQQQTFEATMSHFAAAPDWTEAVSIGAHAFLAFMATHPATAHLGNIGAFASGPAGLELRARGLELFKTLLDEGFRQYPDTDPIAREAIAASVDALMLSWLRHQGAGRLYETAPTAVFITLAPFIGNERACELANADPPLVAADHGSP